MKLADFLRKHEAKGLLRFITCGSVDDGKSTLIGRMLHDTQQILEDQLAAVTSDSRKWGTTGNEVDLALLVDGLQAEREQGITIDVAYRYFDTEKRKYIIADCPGHEQYTRNMATGASTADLAVILIDAFARRPDPDPPPRLHRLAARHPAHHRRGQQDGPRRLRREGVPSDPRRMPRGHGHQVAPMRASCRCPP